MVLNIIFLLHALEQLIRKSVINCLIYKIEEIIIVSNKVVVGNKDV